jgi:mono/diheme cytochrome c family protein
MTWRRTPLRTALVATALGWLLVMSGCGGGDDGAARATTSTVSHSAMASRPAVLASSGHATVTIPAGPAEPVDAPVPASAHGAARGTFIVGRGLTATSGCLACHQIGASGNRGPGPNLTRVGARLSEHAIRRVLTRARAPMPDFGTLLPARELDVLAAFLAALRGKRR